MADAPTFDVPSFGSPADDDGGGPGRGRLKRAGIVVGILAVLGGAVFAATSLRGDSDSSGDPEQAVRALIEAVNNEDVLGVLAAMPPSEREPLQAVVDDLVPELRRLEVLSDDVDLSDLGGFEVDVTEAAFQTETLADGIAVVGLEGAEVTVSFNPAELPLGDLVHDLAGGAIDEAGSVTEQMTLEDGARVATIREDGDWYTSLWYTVAESARRDAGAPLPPSFGNRPHGADSAEQVVRDFVDATVDVDIRRMIDLLPPDEARVLHDYAPLFLDQAEQDAADVQQMFSDIRLHTLDLASERKGDTTLVTVEDLDVEATTTADAFFGFFDLGSSDEESPELLHLRYRDGCIEVEAGPDQDEWCGAEKVRAVPGLGLVFFFMEEEPPHVNLEHPDAGFVTVERDGRWYISPTRTTVGTLVAFLRVLDRDKLDDLSPYYAWLFDIEDDYDDEFAVPPGTEQVPPDGEWHEEVPGDPNAPGDYQPFPLPDDGLTIEPGTQLSPELEDQIAEIQRRLDELQDQPPSDDPPAN